MRKICVITATRAEYGLLRPLMDLLKASNEFVLQIVATGTHLSPEFGLTFQQIESDGFTISEKMETLLSSDTATGIVKTMGMTMISLGEVFSRLQPDLMVILGDRYEMLAVASAATIFKIPIAHIHGGEITAGAYDDAIRHAITKLSHFHFTSTGAYRNRIIQMGENPDLVHNVGAIGLDNIQDIPLLSREALEKELGVTFDTFNYQITFHPETLSNKTAEEQFEILLKVVNKQKDSFFVFTKANADTDGRIINQMIDEFVSRYPDKSVAFHSLGTLRFLSLIQVCTAIVGNSSSGIIEAPSLHTATINIGDRQKGRIQAESVLNVRCDFEELDKAFQSVQQASFQHNLSAIDNPYGSGGTAQKIYNVLANQAIPSTYKTFQDL